MTYEALLRDGVCAALAGVDEGDVVRLESPGQNAAVERAVIERGARRAGAIDTLDHAALALGERGRILHPDLWYRGYADLLREIESQLAPRGVRWMNHPADVALMFDKTACHDVLQQAGVRVAPRLAAVKSYAELVALLREQNVARVFVKLRYASSASGIVALRIAGEQAVARTTLELVETHDGERLYNSRRIRELTDTRDISRTVDALCASDVHVERWLPKASHAGLPFDLRVLVIGQKIRHIVVRQSSSPMTNLHLGGRRGDVESVLAKIPAAAKRTAWADCQRIAELFPRSHYFGIDLLFTPSFRHHAVLEVNAFGDLLPGALDAGEDTYEAEIRALLKARHIPA